MLMFPFSFCLILVNSSIVFFLTSLHTAVISIPYAHVHDEKKRKLDDRSMKCIFVGYYEDTKAYRLYNTQNEIFLVSHDVFFHEK
jgi:hypothetical protein